MDYLAGMEG